MDVEKNQKNDESDENVQSELVQEAAKNVLTENAHSEHPSNQKISSVEGENYSGKNSEKNGTAKRPLSRSVGQELIETNILENEPVLKRLKLTVASHAETNESKLSNSTMGEDSVDGTSSTAEQATAINAFPVSEALISTGVCVQQDFSSEGNSTQAACVEKENPEKDPTLLIECTSSSQNDKTNDMCTTGSVEKVLRCTTCAKVFFTYPDLEKHIQESHLKQSEEHVNPHYTYKSECTPSLQRHIKQAPGQLRLYFCDLCGFQSFEEHLLRAHFLGKTHLRRQKLAARGGFVKILTKKSFLKKRQYRVKEKSVRIKGTGDKPKTRNTNSDELKPSSNKTNLKTSGRLFVEMVPSKNVSVERTESVASEEAFFCNVDGNSDVQAVKLDTLCSSDSNPEMSQPAKGNHKTVSHLTTTGTDRFQHKRSILSRKITFKQSGSFRLNQQIKRRYNLLGICKRSKPDSNLKHRIRTEICQGDLSQASLKALQMEDDVDCLCKATSEMQELTPNGTEACASVTMELENSPKKMVDVQKTLHPCTHCGCTLQNTKDLDLVVDRDQAEEQKFHCRTCGYSCATGENLEHQCQKNNHVGSCRMNCHHCSFLAPNNASLGKHMCDEHGMSHYCDTCHLYFLTEEEMAAHNTTEQHIDLLSQENAFQPLNSDVAMQTTSCTLMESSVLPKVACDIEVTLQQEIPKASVMHPANEFKESVLNRTQFQCKKCFYKTRSSSVLTRHIKLRHAQEYHFLCKACNLYSLSKEGMEKHIKRSKHLENARKNNIGLLFDECIERVCVGASDSKKGAEPSVYGSLKTISENESIKVPLCTLEDVSINKELFPPGETVKGSDLALGSTPKRGRPKGTISRTCPHCGLLASSVTNLTVHIRRKHSHQYSYLCKVCNYYTVTKGDMERHCATKKHKGRLEANGKQNAEIIVCPEGSNVEASSKKINSSGGVLSEPVDPSCQSPHLDTPVLDSQKDDQLCAIQTQIANTLQLPELDSNKNPAEIKHLIAELGATCQDGDSLVQTRSASANDNKCIHCNFVTHSFSSLEVHIKRKHTKEFEYYCMACNYYAVTRREMMRHAATEKHKIKRQSYMCASFGEETESTDNAKESAILSQEGHQPTEEFQIILGETKYNSNVEVQSIIQKDKTIDCSASKDSAISMVLKEGNAFDAADVVLKGGTDQGRENVVGEGVQPKVVVAKLGEIITLKETVDWVLQESIDGQEITKSNINFTADSGNKNETFGKDSPNLNLLQSKSKLEKDTEKEYENAEDSTKEVKAEDTPLPILPETCGSEEQQNIDALPEKAIQNMHHLQEEKSIQVDSTIEEEIDAQQEAEVSLWDSDGSIVEAMQESSSEALDTFTSADGKVKEGTAEHNGVQFDSSIVKLKSHEDGCEPDDHFGEREALSGLKVCETAMKTEVSHGSGKKKKADGNSQGEVARIRCDDCGFLADGLSGLNVHIAMKHPSKEKHFHCLLCGKSFYTESNLHQHLASAGHMRNEQASVEELPEGGATFKCVKCTEPFDSEQNLFLHIKEQHEELLREVNKYIIEDTEQINREREENKGNICKYCGKMCRSSNSMAFLAHIRTHTGRYQQMEPPLLAK